MYTGTIKLTENNIYPLLALADKYMITELKDFCAEYLMEFVNPHNVKRALDTLCHAESFNVSLVVEKCMGVIASYMQNMTGGYVSRLMAKQLIQLVSRDDIVVNDEFALLNKVEHWYGNES